MEMLTSLFLKVHEDILEKEHSGAPSDRGTALDLRDIDRHEFKMILEHPEVLITFRLLDIDAASTGRLFHMLDRDNSGTVNFNEFVEGCLGLRGGATASQVLSIQ